MKRDAVSELERESVWSETARKKERERGRDVKKHTHTHTHMGQVESASGEMRKKSSCGFCVRFRGTLKLKSIAGQA